MYGPPPHADQAFAPTGLWSAWPAWWACASIGVALMLIARPKKPLLFALGGTILFTAPAAIFAPTYVWGAFPTIDKAGSLLFYRDGVHWRVLDPTDPAVKLIGVHLGHLWVTAGLDLVLRDFAAFNVQHLLHLVLAWAIAARLIEALCGRRDVAVLFAAPFALNLHQLRDINWYTVEKTAVFWIPAYGWALWAAARHGGRWVWAAAAVLAVACAYNLYIALLCCGIGALALLLPSPALRRAVLASAVAALPFAAYQAGLQRGPGALASPDAFQARAALDVVELWPPKWNRLEAWRALDLVALVAAARGATDLLRGRAVGVGGRALEAWLFLVALGFGVLSLGPANNPVYAAINVLVPGFWRMAKPEAFFHVTWLALLIIAARAVTRRGASPRSLRRMGAAMALLFLLAARTHPVWPRFTLPVDVTLAKGWQDDVLRGKR